MKHFDRVLQRWRIQRAAEFISSGDRVLDIGCADGALFRLVQDLGPSAGVEPGLDHAIPPSIPNVTFFTGYFPDAILGGPGLFDVSTMLAVLEHVPTACSGRPCASLRGIPENPGKLVILVPSPAVDYVLAVLRL